jgi:hypothetical protein
MPADIIPRYEVKRNKNLNWFRRAAASVRRKEELSWFLKSKSFNKRRIYVLLKRIYWRILLWLTRKKKILWALLP